MESLTNLGANVLAATDPELLDVISTNFLYPNSLHDEYILVNTALGHFRDLENTDEQIDMQQSTFVKICKNIILKRYNTLDISHYNCLPDLKTFEDMFIGVDTSNITCFRVHHNKTFNFDYLSIILKACTRLEIIDIYGCRLITSAGLVGPSPLIEEIEDMFIPLAGLKRFRLQHYIADTFDIHDEFMHRINNCLLFKSSKKGSKLQSIAIDGCDHNRFNVPYRPTITDYGNIVHLSLRNVFGGREELIGIIVKRMKNIVHLDLSTTYPTTGYTDCKYILSRLPTLRKLCIHGCRIHPDVADALDASDLDRLDMFSFSVNNNNIINNTMRLLERYLEVKKSTHYEYVKKYLTKFWMVLEYLNFGYDLIFSLYDYYMGYIMYYKGHIVMYMDEMEKDTSKYELKFDEEFQRPKDVFKLFYGFFKDPRYKVCIDRLQQTLSRYVEKSAIFSYRFRDMSELMDLILELAIAKDDIQSSQPKRLRLQRSYNMLNNVFLKILIYTQPSEDGVDGIVDLFKRYYLDRQEISIIKVCRVIVHYTQVCLDTIENDNTDNNQINFCLEDLQYMVDFVTQLICVGDIDAGINNTVEVELIKLLDKLVQIILKAEELHPQIVGNTVTVCLLCGVNMLMFTLCLYVPMYNPNWQEYIYTNFWKVRGNPQSGMSETTLKSYRNDVGGAGEEQFYCNWIQLNSSHTMSLSQNGSNSQELYCITLLQIMNIIAKPEGDIVEPSD